MENRNSLQPIRTAAPADRLLGRVCSVGGRRYLDCGFEQLIAVSDADAARYTMRQYDQDYIDGNTGEKVEFSNVLALSVKIAVLDGEGRISVDTTAGGEGWFACGGKWGPITWARDAGDSFRYYNADGSELTLAEGESYIALVPTTGSVTIE